MERSARLSWTGPLTEEPDQTGMAGEAGDSSAGALTFGERKFAGRVGRFPLWQDTRDANVLRIISCNYSSTELSAVKTDIQGWRELPFSSIWIVKFGFTSYSPYSFVICFFFFFKDTISKISNTGHQSMSVSVELPGSILINRSFIHGGTRVFQPNPTDKVWKRIHFPDVFIFWCYFLCPTYFFLIGCLRHVFAIGSVISTNYLIACCCLKSPSSTSAD